MKKTISIIFGILIVTGGVFFGYQKYLENSYERIGDELWLEKNATLFVSEIGIAPSTDVPDAVSQKLYLISNIADAEVEKYQKEFGLGYPEGFVGVFVDITDSAKEVANPYVVKEEVIAQKPAEVKKRFIEVSNELGMYQAVEYQIVTDTKTYHFYGNQMNPLNWTNFFEQKIVPAIRIP